MSRSDCQHDLVQNFLFEVTGQRQKKWYAELSSQQAFMCFILFDILFSQNNKTKSVLKKYNTTFIEAQWIPVLPVSFQYCPYVYTFEMNAAIVMRAYMLPFYYHIIFQCQPIFHSIYSLCNYNFNIKDYSVA